VHARHKDDRRPLEARVLVDQLRGLEAIHTRHADVEKDHGELAVHQALERLDARRCRHQPVAERAEDRLVGDEPRGLVIHQQDVDRLDAGHRAHAGS
jgi:hypothetical protein